MTHSQLMSVSLHGWGDDLDAMVGDVVTALGLTDVTLDEQRDYPADGVLGPFTTLTLGARTRGGGDHHAARAWARRAGVDVPARGRVPAAIMRRWRDAGEPRP